MERERDDQPQLNPKAIIDYNKNMRLVDKSYMISFNECLRKTQKWYKKYFFHLMDLCVLNAYYIHSSLTGKKTGLRVFSLTLYVSGGRNMAPPQPPPAPLALPVVGRLQCGRHYPVNVPSTEKKKNAQRICCVCAHTRLKQIKKSYTRYMCKECNVPLCILGCFEMYPERVVF
ncbi:piggyBac transposable element-derived protein 4-like [Penaeus monodon]|uniref:piggyBac transposable element-derived protein 4-like n=1 Tax=Penaeus monodon TaxID=6687 RepID=UPI0018A72FF8|nr:piggyBac transposable element-derived protein 4-like [Penaeus monodon]